MALINCPECKKEISDKTKTCPLCGFPIPEQEQQVAKMLLDKDEMSNEKEIPVNDQISKAPSFLTYPTAKILICLSILSLFLSAFLIYTSIKVSTIELKVQEIQYSVSTKASAMEQRVREIEDSLRLVSSIEQRVQDVEDNSKLVSDNLLLVITGIEASEGVVTDKAVIKKATFYSRTPGEITGNIDIRPQPTYTNKFLGHGNFDLSDRELKVMLEELMNSLVTFIGNSYNLKTISITANNYAVAEYKDGVITLAGE